MLQARREKIAEALANAEKIKADVAKTEAERQKILADAGDKANKLIDEARQAAARVRETGNAKSHRRRRTNRRQGARSRRAGTRANACGIETRSRPACRADDLDRHRKNSYGGRSKTARGRNRETIVRINSEGACGPDAQRASLPNRNENFQTSATRRPATVPQLPRQRFAGRKPRPADGHVVGAKKSRAATSKFCRGCIGW